MNILTAVRLLRLDAARFVSAGNFSILLLDPDFRYSLFMKITSEHIKLFKDAYFSEFKEMLTDNDAEIMIHEFLCLMEILSKPLPDEKSVIQTL